MCRARVREGARRPEALPQHRSAAAVGFRPCAAFVGVAAAEALNAPNASDICLGERWRRRLGQDWASRRRRVAGHSYSELIVELQGEHVARPSAQSMGDYFRPSCRPLIPTFDAPVASEVLALVGVGVNFAAQTGDCSTRTFCDFPLRQVKAMISNRNFAFAPKRKRYYNEVAKSMGCAMDAQAPSTASFRYWMSSMLCWRKWSIRKASLADTRSQLEPWR